METHGVIETFQDHQDAVSFFENTLFQYAAEGWDTVSNSGIRYIDHEWEVGMQFKRSTNGQANF